MDGSGAARWGLPESAREGHAPASKIYSQARVEHASAREGQMDGSAVTEGGEDGQEPIGEARELESATYGDERRGSR
jgi:hypothetical protein